MPKSDTQFKKGKSGNPKGRPKMESTFSDTARELMEAKEINVSWNINGKEKKLRLTSDHNMYHGIAAALIVESLKGNTKAIRELIDRTEGKAIMRASVESNGNIIVNFREKDANL